MHTLLFIISILFSLQTPFVEKDGFVEVEAEAFHRQSQSTLRNWYITDAETTRSQNDPDSLEHLTASQGSFIELLPDTRVTHDDELQPGINFSPEPGLSVLEYEIEFTTPGKYYVWVRAFSTGTEDNGLHVGIDGLWPDSGKRMQWCEGKNEWTWASKQRTDENHCGEEKRIFLQIEDTGIHTITFSMREDGFAFDKFILSQTYQLPSNP
ncbi:MAG: hypothetical protein AAGC85_24860 [Bacteroidota bacterium]